MKPIMLYVAVLAAAFAVACGGATNQTPTAEGAAGPEATAPAENPPAETAPQASQPPPQRASNPPAPRPSAPAPSAPAPAAPRPAAPPPQPQTMMVRVPAGTVLEMELSTALSSKTNLVGDVFQAKTIAPVSIGGQEVIPAGSTVEGTVTEAVSAKKMSGQASLSLRFSKLTLPSGEVVEISGTLSEKGKAISKRTAGIVGGSAAGGALLGRIIGKDTKGAVVGALAGAALGTGIAAAQKGQELKLPEGTGLAIEVDSPFDVSVKPTGS